MPYGVNGSLVVMVGRPVYLPTIHETFLKRFEKVSKRFLVKKRCINVFKMFSQKFHET